LLAKQIENEKLKTKSRIEKFLEAVKKLPEEHDESEQNENPTTTRSNKSNSTSRSNVLRRSKSIEDLENTPAIKQTRNAFRLRNNRTQFIRKNSIGANQSQASTQRDQSASNDLNAESKFQKTSKVNIEKKARDMVYPWVKTPFAVNNYDNRLKNQEKLLHEQQNMIKGSFFN
jgi:hypothetical protein